MTDPEKDSNAKKFILDLQMLTEAFLNNLTVDEFKASAQDLKKLFDLFAIIDEFDSFLIIDCYNEIRISMMKLELMADKTSQLALEFKQLLNHFYEVMKDLYFYEIFGFFSTTVWPEDLPDWKLPCRIFCGCADGWQKEPYLTIEGRAEYENVIRFQDPQNKELFCISIDNQRLLEDREKCSLSDEQLETIKNFVRVNKGIIVLHNMALIDSPSFLGALKIKIAPKEHKIKYRIVYSYRECIAGIKWPLNEYYIDMDDMPYKKAVKLFNQIKQEMQKSLNVSPEDYDLAYLEILRPGEGKNFCCFCNSVFDGDGNSTWPIYYQEDGEKFRCCDECNKKYVIAAREDRTLIMKFRKQFGIDYTEYAE